jgi:hypothetical protein
MDLGIFQICDRIQSFFSLSKEFLKMKQSQTIVRKLFGCLAPFALVALVTGCASIQYGDKTVEASLKKFSFVPGKTSLYVCRVSGFVAGGVTSKVLVDNKEIGNLKPNTFVHTVIEPGTHDVQLVHDGINGSSGIHKIDTKSDEISFVWAGVTGGGFGVLTVDNFNKKQEGFDCVNGAAYSVVSSNK